MANLDTIGAALSYGATRLDRSPTARRDAELLLMHVLGRDRAYLLTHPEAQLTSEQGARYEESLARRVRHEPIQYIIGEQEFFGLKFRVTPDVLIPRPETEHLVEAALARVDREASLHIADIGTGSGAIAVALAQALPQAQVTALDLSPEALVIAQRNATRHHVSGRIRICESDLLDAVAGESFHMIVSNPPYVAEVEVLEPQVRHYEPASALFAGVGGLDVYRRLIPQAQTALKPGGWLLLEIGHGQRDALAQLLAGWNNVSFIADLQGIPRVACAQRKE
jgi:release factor glutamine methyltransferase